jgi:hypothetical protein
MDASKRTLVLEATKTSCRLAQSHQCGNNSQKSATKWAPKIESAPIAFDGSVSKLRTKQGRPKKNAAISASVAVVDDWRQQELSDSADGTPADSDAALKQALDLAWESLSWYYRVMSQSVYYV